MEQSTQRMEHTLRAPVLKAIWYHSRVADEKCRRDHSFVAVSPAVSRVKGQELNIRWNRATHPYEQQLVGVFLIS